MGTLSEERTTFRYDDHDNPIAEISDSRSRGMDIDDDGAARTSEEEPRAHHHRFDYQYDDRGNWTEQSFGDGLDRSRSSSTETSSGGRSRTTNCNTWERSAEGWSSGAQTGGAGLRFLSEHPKMGTERPVTARMSRRR